MDSPRDDAVLDFLRSYMARTHRSPSYREIAEALDCSVRTAYVAVGRLIAKGLVESVPGLHRSLKVIA